MRAEKGKRERERDRERERESVCVCVWHCYRAGKRCMSVSVRLEIALVSLTITTDALPIAIMTIEKTVRPEKVQEKKVRMLV